jgi:hypothetical protein
MAALKALMLKSHVVIIKKKTTSNAKPTICISSTNEMKTQVRWTIVIGQRVKR